MVFPSYQAFHSGLPARRAPLLARVSKPGFEILDWLSMDRDADDLERPGVWLDAGQPAGWKWQRRSLQSDVLSACESQAVLSDLETNERWYEPLFLPWLSTGMRHAEIRGLNWDCIRWDEGEVPFRKSLRPDGDSSGNVEWAPTKTGKQRVLPLKPLAMDVLRQHQGEMEHLGLCDPYGLVFSFPSATPPSTTIWWVCSQVKQEENSAKNMSA